VPRQPDNPFDHLKDLFTHLPSAKITDITRFTPTVWAKAKAHETTLTVIAARIFDVPAVR
jgi:hypothetical protein